MAVASTAHQYGCYSRGRQVAYVTAAAAAASGTMTNTWSGRPLGANDRQRYAQQSQTANVTATRGHGDVRSASGGAAGRPGGAACGRVTSSPTQRRDVAQSHAGPPHVKQQRESVTVSVSARTGRPPYPRPGDPGRLPRVDPLLRPTARVLLLDAADRLLLFRSVDEAGLGYWYPAGGAVDPGETYEQAAVREVREETGADVVLGPHVWNRRHVVAWGGVRYDVRERWYLARVEAFDLDVRGWTPLEVANITAHRWWSLDDLARSGERLVPTDLANLLADLLRDGPPAAPYEVPV